MSVDERSCPDSSKAASSHSAWPMPCPRPPCTWPWTSSGLMRKPASSTDMYVRIVTRPVSLSTSTVATWEPKGKSMSLPVGGRAREHGHAPVVGHHEVRDLVLLEAADLDVGGEPDAHEPALGARRLLLPAQIFVAGLDERMVEGARVLAAVVGVAER